MGIMFYFELVYFNYCGGRQRVAKSLSLDHLMFTAPQQPRVETRERTWRVVNDAAPRGHLHCSHLRHADNNKLQRFASKGPRNPCRADTVGVGGTPQSSGRRRRHNPGLGNTSEVSRTFGQRSHSKILASPKCVFLLHKKLPSGERLLFCFTKFTLKK